MTKWLRDIPGHWTVAPVKRHFNVRLGKQLQNDRLASSDRRVSYLKAKHVQWHSTHTDDLPQMWASPCDIEQFGVRSGDLLVCEGGEGGRCTVVTDPGDQWIIQNALHRVRPSDEELRRDNSANLWLQFVLRAVASTGWLDAINNKATIAHFTVDKFNALMIPIPPAAEQGALVVYLQHEMAKIDALIRKKETLVDRLEEHRTVLISRTVTRGLPFTEARRAGFDPDPRLKLSGVEWLGEVPEHWEVKRGKYIFDVVDIRSITGHEELLTVSSKHGVVPRASSDVSVTMFRAESYVGSKLCWPGDLVINSLWAWGCGLGVSPHHGIVSSAYGVYRLRRCYREYAGYVHWLVRSHAFQRELQVRSQGIWVSRLQLTDESFLAAYFSLPPDREQAAIAEYLGHATQVIDKAISLARKEINLLREYRTRLISDVVTGRVDMQGVSGMDQETTA